jgi:hypothetical protein
LKIGPDTSLADVAFAVCTALDAAGVHAVLTGGSAATVWAPDAYQSRDLDFVMVRTKSSGVGEAALGELGYERAGDHFEHSKNPLILEFPPGPLAVGGDLIERWTTLRRSARKLRIITPTDCVRDRLAGFLFWNDRGSLAQALGVASAQRRRIRLETIRSWCEREGHVEGFLEFERALRNRKK